MDERTKRMLRLLDMRTQNFDLCDAIRARLISDDESGGQAEKDGRVMGSHGDENEALPRPEGGRFAEKSFEDGQRSRPCDACGHHGEVSAHGSLVFCTDKSACAARRRPSRA